MAASLGFALIFLRLRCMIYRKPIQVLSRFFDSKRAFAIACGIETELSRTLPTITFIDGGLGISFGFAI